MTTASIDLRPAPVLAIGVIGHRGIGIEGEAAHAVEAALARMLREVDASFRKIVTAERPFFSDAEPILRVIGTAADGSGLLAARAARANGAEFALILPFAPEDYAKDFATPAARELAKTIIGAARVGHSGDRDRPGRARAGEASAWPRRGSPRPSHCDRPCGRAARGPDRIAAGHRGAARGRGQTPGPRRSLPRAAGPEPAAVRVPAAAENICREPRAGALRRGAARGTERSAAGAGTREPAAAHPGDRRLRRLLRPPVPLEQRQRFPADHLRRAVFRHSVEPGRHIRHLDLRSADRDRPRSSRRGDRRQAPLARTLARLSADRRAAALPAVSPPARAWPRQRLRHRVAAEAVVGRMVRAAERTGARSARGRDETKRRCARRAPGSPTARSPARSIITAVRFVSSDCWSSVSPAWRGSCCGSPRRRR